MLVLLLHEDKKAVRRAVGTTLLALPDIASRRSAFCAASEFGPFPQKLTNREADIFMSKMVQTAKGILKLETHYSSDSKSFF